MVIPVNEERQTPLILNWWLEMFGRGMFRTYTMLVAAYLVWFGLIFAGVAYAQTPAVPVTPSSQCPNSIVSHRHTYGALGQHVAVLCTNSARTELFLTGFSCVHSSCDMNAFTGAALRIATASDVRKTIDAEWANAIKWDCDAPPDQPRAALCEERKKWVDANVASWASTFKPSVWVVKRNGTGLTRPAYSFVNGVVGTVIVARPKVTTTVCDLTKPTAPATNGDIRAEFGIPKVVTICERIP